MLNCLIDYHTYDYIHVHTVYPAQWYQLHSGYNISTYMKRLNDDKRWSCDELDTTGSSQLLKATLTPYYTSLNVTIYMKLPVLIFDPAHPKCDKATSLLMTHDSSEAIANGLTCNPFCEVPYPCQLVQNPIQIKREKFQYRFLCHCSAQSCNELFIVLRPKKNKSIAKICDVLLENL